MQKRIVAYYVGQLFIVLSFFMLAPLALAFYDNSQESLNAYTMAILISIGSGIALRYFAHRLKVNILSISRKEAIGIVALGWLGCGLLGGLPFLFENSISDISASTFEAISGLTTTGATVIGDIEALSRATHLWRVVLHWIGGMGIVVLFVAIFPHIGLGGKHLFKTEVAGPITEGLKPRIKQTALRLWWVYMAFTAICTGLLYLTGMSLFDSICHSFSTLSTGGFSTRAASLGAFEDPWAEWIVIFFMMAGGINFGLYYGVFRGHFSKLFSSTEVQFYVLLNVVVGVVIFFDTSTFNTELWHDEFRDAMFQTVAVSTTTGLMTADFDQYPALSKYLLFLLMFIGGCAGSTAGGLKVSRVLIVFKRSIQELRLTLHPQEVVSTKLGKQTISRRVLSAVFIFVCAYFLLYLAGVFLMLLIGLDWLTAASSVVATLSSVGPGFARVGPIENYNFIHPLGKWILSFLMIAGRLEIFVLLTLFTPSFWRKG